jgi:hypothetical protein
MGSFRLGLVPPTEFSPPLARPTWRSDLPPWSSRHPSTASSIAPHVERAVQAHSGSARRFSQPLSGLRNVRVPRPCFVPQPFLAYLPSERSPRKGRVPLSRSLAPSQLSTSSRERTLCSLITLGFPTSTYETCSPFPRWLWVSFPRASSLPGRPGPRTVGSLPPTRFTCLEAFFPLRVRSHPARVAPGPVVAALLVFRPSRDPLRPRILKPARPVPARSTASRKKRLPARLQRAAVRTRRLVRLRARPPNAHPKAHAAQPRPNTHLRHAPAHAPRRVRSPLPAPTHEAEASRAFTQATVPQPEGRDQASSGSNDPKAAFACARPLEPTPEGLCPSFDPRRRWPPVTRRPPETAASSGSRDRSHVPRRLSTRARLRRNTPELLPGSSARFQGQQPSEPGETSLVYRNRLERSRRQRSDPSRDRAAPPLGGNSFSPDLQPRLPTARPSELRSI